MARRHKHVAHGNHERWIVSYADFMTLLFAFFVVMFATANADRGKAGVVAAAVRAALNESKTHEIVPGSPGAAAGPGNGKIDAERLTKTAAELLPSMQLLERELHGEIQRGNVEVNMSARGLTVSFKQAGFFDSGSDIIKGEALASIVKVGKALSVIPNRARLEGHTDNVPISNARFSDNWSLSAARAVAVVNALTTDYKSLRLRLSVGGYADVAPIATNATEEGRARNRRVDLVILSEYGDELEPGKPPEWTAQP